MLYLQCPRAMNDTEKPFACSIKDCDMTFTNEDHLNWHQKKHDMMLNLGLANKQSEIADQTPTPTRFIRNCEEVGLFQDLQSVNPFDEFFRKAVEATKAGVTLEVQQNNSEDTLHTPHILPHIEESQKKLNNLVEDGNSHSNDFLQNVIPITSAGNACELEVMKVVEAPLIVINDDDNNIEKQRKDKLERVKLRVKEVLQKKGKEKTKSNNKKASPIVPTRALCNQEKTCNPKSEEAITTNKRNGKKASSVIDEIREMNRAAQIRCRKRKRESQLKMEAELKRLQIENERLKVENEFLKGQIRFNIEANTALSASINKSNDATNSISTSDQQTKLPEKEKHIPEGQAIILQVVSPVTIPIATQQKTEVKKSLKRIFPKISI